MILSINVNSDIKISTNLNKSINSILVMTVALFVTNSTAV